MSDLNTAELRRMARAGCYGIVTRHGEQDACEKPVTVIIDGRYQGEDYWPACTYHGHRYGAGRIVPLAEILTRVTSPAKPGAES